MGAWAEPGALSSVRGDGEGRLTSPALPTEWMFVLPLCSVVSVVRRVTSFLGSCFVPFFITQNLELGRLGVLIEFHSGNSGDVY